MKEKMVQVSVVLPAEVKAELRRLAAEDRRDSLSQYLRYILCKHVEAEVADEYDAAQEQLS